LFSVFFAPTTKEVAMGQLRDRMLLDLELAGSMLTAEVTS
jgi:hypothetical protein